MKICPHNPIIHFLLKILLLASLILIIDHGVGSVLKFFYFRQESGPSYRTTYSIDSTLADIIVIGSSRANHGYVSEIFENRFSCTFYNTGKDGNYVLYNYAVFKAITMRYNPKMIIFDIRPEDIIYNAFEYDRLSTLLPYYQSHPEIADIMKYRGPFEKIKLISAIYPYNSMIFKIAMGNLEYNIKREPEDNGYVPLFITMKYKGIETLKSNIRPIDENKTDALEDIIYTCKRKNIDLVFVFSPIWIKIPYSPDENIISNLCLKNDIKYLNLSNDSIFINNPGYFVDPNHLNDEGARVFSSLLIEKIKEIE